MFHQDVSLLSIISGLVKGRQQMRYLSAMLRIIFRIIMISTKLNKNASASHLLVEFSDKELHPVLQKFYLNCKDQNVLTRRTPTLDPTQMNFHTVELQQKMQINNITLKNVPHNFDFVISVFYINSEEEEERREKIPPIQRSLLLRQSLDMNFFMDYEFENTQSQQESLIFLCQLSAAIVNSMFEREISFYDQNTSNVKGQHQNQAQKCWTNILFQIPGLGQQKCKNIAQRYPSYKVLLLDFLGEKELSDMPVRSGVKEIRLGEVMANRIYKGLFGMNSQENIMSKK